MFFGNSFPFFCFCRPKCLILLPINFLLPHFK
nr:MAG TPA: hypothetical protein [Bacteriophage sp.]